MNLYLYAQAQTPSLTSSLGWGRRKESATTQQHDRQATLHDHNQHMTNDREPAPIKLQSEQQAICL